MKWHQWLLLIPLSVFAYIQLITWIFFLFMVSGWYWGEWTSAGEDLPEYHYVVTVIFFIWTNQILNFFKQTK